MKGRDIIKDMVSSGTTGSETNSPSAVHKPAGAVRAMNLSLGRLNAEASAAKELREAIAAGDNVVELDTALIDVSFIEDRIPVDSDAQLDQLAQSIAENGQQVPILVRPHASKANHYQVVYGHRRLKAATRLKRAVKAIVRSMSDEEAILAQGQENGSRVDLSFIERSLFARRLSEHGISRDIIAKALSIDKPEVSRLLQVAESVDAKLILAVGPAPKVGRPRWIALANALNDGKISKKIGAELLTDDFHKLDSNKRFERLWKATQNQSAETIKAEIFRTKNGVKLAKVDRGSQGTRISIGSAQFADYLLEKLPSLIEGFENQ